MKSFVVIVNTLTNYTQGFEVDVGGVPDIIWRNVIQAINEITDEAGSLLTFDKLYKRLIEFDGYSNEIEEGDDWIDFEITINYENNSVTMIALNRHGIECFRKTYVTTTTTGNCIDDFINRGIEPLLNDISNLKDSIKSRKNNRIRAIEYHKTNCYEQDFGQIVLIKQLAEKIVKNCNTHLERISEFYTKID